MISFKFGGRNLSENISLKEEKDDDLQDTTCNNEVIEKYNEVIKKFEIYYSVRTQHQVRQQNLSDLEILEIFAKEVTQENYVYEKVIKKIRNNYSCFNTKTVAGL